MQEGKEGKEKEKWAEVENGDEWVGAVTWKDESMEKGKGKCWSNDKI